MPGQSKNKNEKRRIDILMYVQTLEQTKQFKDIA
jgi:hypothetical protein